MYLDGIFDLIDIVKNKFKKKTVEQELDDYLDSEMPGEPNQINKPTRSILNEEEFNNIRKNL